MDKLGIDVKLLIAQLVNFGLFFFIFQKFIAKPFLGLIKSEEKKEKAKHAFEVEMIEQKEQAEQEEKKAKERLNSQIKVLLDSARKEAEVVKKSMIESAKKEAADVVVQSRRQMEEESRLMEQTIKHKVADLSLLIVKEAMKDYLTENMQKEMTQHIISRIKN